MCPLVLSRSWPILIHRCRASVKIFPLKGVGPVRTRLRISISRNLSMKVPPIGLALYVRIGPLSRKRAPPPRRFLPQDHCDQGMASTMSTTSSSCDECGTRILSQPRLPRHQKVPGAWCVGRLQRGVYQPILQS